MADMLGFVVVMIGVSGLVLGLVWARLRRSRRAEFIRHHPLPRGLYEALRRPSR